MTVPTDRVVEAHRIAAQAVILMPELLPVFLRLERELAERDAEAQALARARAVARGEDR